MALALAPFQSQFNLRARQKDAFVRMLDLTTGGDGEEVYKVLVLDRPCRDIVSPLIRVNDLRKHGVTLHLLIETERQRIEDVPALYFLSPTEANVKKIAEDLAAGLYDSAHLNFSSSLPRLLLEELANQTVKAECVNRVAKLYDQYMNFVCLDARLFSLSQPRTYLQLNDPSATEQQIEATIAEVVNGLFSVLVTLGVVPIIRSPKGGAAQMVASQLDARIRDHLLSRSNLFNESAMPGSAPISRPVLCIFDRNFELASQVQHVWTYQPLVGDVLAMRLNRINIMGPATPTAPGGKKSFELDTETDPFWDQHQTAQFPKVAEEVEAELTKYKAAVANVTSKTQVTPEDVGVQSTDGLMKAVSSLPELTERKRIIDKHTNIATALLNQIKARSLDSYYVLEEELLTAKADRAAVSELMSPTAKGTPEDKLRLAIIQVLSAEAAPPHAEVQAADQALQASGADIGALAYVRKMRSFNIMRSTAGVGVGQPQSSQSQLLEWADKLYGQGITAVAKGVKNLLSGGRQLAVTRAVEAIMDGKPTPETDDFCYFDPRSGKASGVVAPPGGGGAKREAIVFVVGGGNYLEFQSLQELAGRNPQLPRTVIYGGTDILSGPDFIAQLAELGRKSGVA